MTTKESAEGGRRIISIIVLLLTLAGGGWYLWQYPPEFSTLADISVPLLVALVCVQLLLLTTNGLFLKAYALKYNLLLRFSEWFGLAIVTSLGNYLTPFSGGLLLRATYLKQRHKFSYTQFMTLIAAYYSINFGIIGLIGMSVTLMMNRSVTIDILTLLFSLVTAVMIIIALVPSVQLPGHDRISNLLNETVKGLSLVRADKRFLGKLVGYTLGNILFNCAAFWLAYRSLDFDVSIQEALLISLVIAFSIVIKLTPGNLGVYEAIIAITSSVIGVNVEQGILVALVLRISTIIPVFVLGPIYSYLLTNDLVAHRTR